MNDGITNLDVVAADVTKDCNQSAIAIFEVILEHMNKQIREDKEWGYERIGDTVSAELLNMAAEASYAKSSEIVTQGRVTRQSVRNHILKLEVPESRPKEIKKEVSTLHIFADEDHVHMQKPSKKRGKKNRIVPLVTITEGIKRI